MDRNVEKEPHPELNRWVDRERNDRRGYKVVKKRERERERKDDGRWLRSRVVRRGSGTEPKRAFLSDFSLRACSRDHISSRAYAASFISHVSRLEGSSFLTYGP